MEKNEEDFITKLLNGEISLAKTFWLFGFLLNAIFVVILKFILLLEPKFYIFFEGIHIIYMFMMYVAIWKSATKYQGLKLWAILAKTYVVIGLFISILVILNLLLVGVK